MTLITAALNGSNSRWFGGCVWTPPPRGRPSSLIQHCTHQQSRHWMHSWHTRTVRTSVRTLTVGKPCACASRIAL
ncbi:hypothetical protein CJO81_20930 (plasmid) [Ralstonia solanacearum]|nr:hypothetical protein CJO80_21040 [Ralstonia solanacearum]AXW03235.1 hypothetical protein CJO81_20930 [Ralstonia solanacearum]AXW30723.1 hypothetical protein CJO87_20925 [Ralstonia solanacearum]